MTEPLAYSEEQRFRRSWVWGIVIVVAVLGWWAFVQQIVLGKPFGENPAPDWGVWLLWLVIGIGLPALFVFIRLLLEVTTDAVVVRYRPLVRRSIPLADIEQVKVRTYNALREYGGWGVKGWSRKNMAYNVSGDKGVELTLRDGRRVMLGSQRPEELAEAIEKQRHARV
jgi:hypothetical protein